MGNFVLFFKIFVPYFSDKFKEIQNYAKMELLKISYFNLYLLNILITKTNDFSVTFKFYCQLQTFLNNRFFQNLWIL